MAENKDDLISNFCSITGEEAERGQFYLESANWDLSLAIQSFYDNSFPAENPMDTNPVPNPNPNPVPNPNIDQQSARHLMNMFGNQPIVKTNQSSDEDSSQEMSSPKAQKKPTKEVPKRQTSSKFATLDSLKNTESGGSSDEEGQAFYAGGSERSGQQVLGPKKKNTNELVSHMFASAKEHGAEAVDPAEEAKAKKRVNAFVGTGFKLGTTSEPSTAVPSTSVHRTRPHEVLITFWRNGFSLDGGPLRGYNDPQNVEFLQSVTKGEIPRELTQKYKSEEIHVNLEDKKNEEYVQTRQPIQAFTGEGNRLGTPTADIISSNIPSNFDPKISEEEALKRLNLDPNQPITKVQIRLSDGSRLVVKVNLTHTIADIRQFICNSRPIYSTQNFILMTTFPNKELTDESLTVKDANLSNASIVQKIK